MLCLPRPLSALFLGLAALTLAPAPALAAGDSAASVQQTASAASRFVVPSPGHAKEIAAVRYGPFEILNGKSAALIGATDEQSPAQFAAMMRDFPGLQEIEFREGPGTYDDGANLRLGRMIRAAGLATRVDKGGSVRSGAVDLFLAGVQREVADGAEFAVHSWLDEQGREATDYPADAPHNRKYIAYYRDMGMSADEATAFYAMTNSVPHGDALWLTGAEMRHWFAAAEIEELPKLAYLDLGLALY